jgi:N-acyl-D-amino-acid deacylase
MHDLVIRNGSIADGTGRPLFKGDIAIDGDTIVSVGPVAGPGREEIDATDRLVTPGFVDIHTHYDAQAMWDPDMTPSSQHGVTSVIIGNCGVGFAPAAPERRDQLVSMMEHVEDIPARALNEGLPWNWESFPEYLDALAGIPRTIDIGAHIAHASIRNYVMGDRGWDADATDGDIATMAAIVEEGMHAGALGFSTNRSPFHRDHRGIPIPGTHAGMKELMAFGEAMRRSGRYGVLEVAGNPVKLLDPVDWEWMREVSIQTGVPVSYELVQPQNAREEFRELLALTDQANAAGASLYAQVAVRSVALLMNWELSIHPFFTRASWRAIADKPWSEQLAALKDPAFKRQLLNDPIERPALDSGATTDLMLFGWDRQFPVTQVPNYEPGPAESVAGIARALGKDPQEVAYDAITAEDGRGLIYIPLFNYAGGDLEDVREMLDHPATIVSLSDGGAHATTVCDASSPTFTLTHWARDRRNGSGTVPVERAVRWQTMETADLYGLGDRGRLEAGKLADINVIDFEKLNLQKPYVVNDLPGGCIRLMQDAIGYIATVKSGQVTFRNGKPTGQRPGGVIRGARAN